MSPILIRLAPAWKPVLDTYDNSTTAENRKAASLFALMRFASTEPNVREGEERIEGFAKYSYYRDNWWCYTVSPPANSNENENNSFLAGSIAHPEPTDPPFLTPADRKQADSEIKALDQIPKASVYFAQQAMAWLKLHPNDPRTPELLGQALRVERNACGDKTTSEIAHQLFLALHLKYPNHHWTLRYKTWE